MKRYDLVTENLIEEDGEGNDVDSGETIDVISEVKNGPYVLYDDVKPLIEAANEMNTNIECDDDCQCCNNNEAFFADIREALKRLEEK